MKQHKYYDEYYDEYLYVRILDFLLLNPFGYVLTVIAVGVIFGCCATWWLG